MKTRFLFPFYFLLCLAAFGSEQRYLYLSSPDAAQSGGRSGSGLLIFDLDHHFQFVRRLEIKRFREGIRGLTGHAKTHRLYYSTTAGHLGCFDLESNRVLWEKKFDRGCDRSSVSADGKKVYVPTGWWYRGGDSGLLVVDASDGAVLKRVPIGLQAHNSLVSLDGQYVFLGTETNLTVLDGRGESILRQFPGAGEFGVFPFTVDSRNHYGYVCLGKHIGFDVVDLQKGGIPYRVYVGGPRASHRAYVFLSPHDFARLGQEEDGNFIPHRTHGVALTPDEKELWISDQEGRKLFIFDATPMPPKEIGQVGLSAGGHGWVCFTLDGRYALCHTPDIIEVRSRKVVQTLEDENGKPVSSSKFIEVHFRDGKVIELGNEFGLGRAHRGQLSASNP